MYRWHSIADYYRSILEQIRADILKETDATIAANSEDLVEEYFHKYALIPIETQQDPIWEYKKYIKKIPAYERESFYRNEGDLLFECEKIDVELNINQNETIEKIAGLQASQYSLSYSESKYQFSSTKIIFSIETKGYWFAHEEDRVVKNLQSEIEQINQLISWKNNDIDKENIQLKQNIQALITARIENIKQSEDKLNSLAKKINIPLKPKELTGAKQIELFQKQAIIKIKPESKQFEEYVLDREKVIAIIKNLDLQGKQFEKTPKSYTSMWEEWLRDILLVNLNSIFQGKATGETFSNSGKSDIYLNIDSGNILVFECKIWDGESLYSKTIDQLRGYLTWRHNFWVMITFSRNTNFSDILCKMENIVKSSISYKGEFKKIADTHFSSLHKVEGDDGKEVEIHHIFYNLYCK